MSSFNSCYNLEDLRITCLADDLKTIIKLLPSQPSFLRVNILNDVEEREEDEDEDEDEEEDENEDDPDYAAQDMDLFLFILDSPCLRGLSYFEFLCTVYSQKVVKKLREGRLSYTL